MLSCIAGEREVFGAASRGYEALSMTVVGACLAWFSARDFTCPPSSPLSRPSEGEGEGECDGEGEGEGTGAREGEAEKEEEKETETATDKEKEKEKEKEKD